MELWLSVTLLTVSVAGIFFAVKFLGGRPAIRRVVILACVVFGAMMLLYTCLTAFMLGFAEPDPALPSDTAPVEATSAAEPSFLYLSLDALDREDGIFYITATTISEDLTVVGSRRFPLDENLAASMLPGWDQNGKRYDFYTAKDFSQYWVYSEEQGFPPVGSTCRFEMVAGRITRLTELDPTGEQLMH